MVDRQQHIVPEGSNTPTHPGWGVIGKMREVKPAVLPS